MRPEEAFAARIRGSAPIRWSRRCGGIGICRSLASSRSADISWPRVRLQEWLNFITSEIHAGSSPLFNRNIPAEARAIFETKLFRRFDEIEAVLATRPYLMGETFTVADAYLYTVLGWMRFFSIDLGRWPATASYVQRIGNRPVVQAALSEEAQTSAVD
jgi:glutathione S-transferase